MPAKPTKAKENTTQTMIGSCWLFHFLWREKNSSRARNNGGVLFQCCQPCKLESSKNGRGFEYLIGCWMFTAYLFGEKHIKRGIANA